MLYNFIHKRPTNTLKLISKRYSIIIIIFISIIIIIIINLYLKPRVSLDGHPSKNGRITNITIDKSRCNKVAEEADDLSVEDILEKHLNIKGEVKSKRQTPYLETNVASPRLSDEDNNFNSVRHERDLVSPKRSVGGRVYSPRPGSRQDYSVIPSRSMTPHDIDSLMVRNSNSENNIKIESKPHASKKSIAPKYPLHKTSAAKGVTFTAGNKAADTSYIQISQKIPTQTENHHQTTDVSSADSASSDSATAIQSVQDENKAEYVALVNSPVDTNMAQQDSPKVTPEVEVEEAPDLTPSSSLKSNPDPDVQYTINIPTADVAESEINSVSDFVDKDG